MRRIRFQPKLVPTLASLAGVAVLVLLGLWQLSRHEEKQALLAEAQSRLALPVIPLAEALTQPEKHAWRRVRAEGVYLHDDTVLVLSRRDSATGSIVLTPLQSRGSPGTDGRAAAIIVDRGWVPADQEERILAQRGRGTPVTVVGSLLLLPDRKGIPDKVSAGDEKRRRWMSLNLGALRSRASVPVVKPLLKRGDIEDGDLPEGGWALPRPRVNHLEYALTWFLIAAILVAVYLTASLCRDD